MVDKPGSARDKVQESTASAMSEAFGSFLTEAVKVQQKTLDPKAQDMMANKALEDKGTLPQSNKVANLSEATNEDRHFSPQNQLAAQAFENKFS